MHNAVIIGYGTCPKAVILIEDFFSRAGRVEHPITQFLCIGEGSAFRPFTCIKKHVRFLRNFLKQDAYEIIRSC
jgi:hypothetical protein